MIRAAIVGLGWWGKTIVGRMRRSQTMAIMAAVELDPERYVPFAAENSLELIGSYDEVIARSDIDAVILCTPNTVHGVQVEAAARAGKHVFCEKPLALTREEAERSVEACRAAGVVLGIGHERRFELAMVEVRRLVQSGALGTVMHAEANFNHDKLANVPQNDWRRSAKESPAAGMTAMGIHLSDAYVSLFGEAAEVFASTADRVFGAENGDVVSALLRFRNGPTAYLNAVLCTPLYLRFTVFGSKAWVEFRNDTHPDTPGPTTLTFQVTGQAPEVTTYEWNDTVRANLEAFVDAIEGRAAYPFTDAEKIGNIAVLEAIIRSAEVRQSVRLD